ncbi:MAG TPA: hypothetical protein VND93_12345 [Myxococcales bacterium]|nr:hypothetical protein [Myxococcales bacterium]
MTAETFSATRQREANDRFDRLVRFYASHGCRMSRVHVLTAAAVTLGRFCGLSESFHRIGEALMPITEDHRLRTRAWRAYARACERGLPVEIRDELWIAAHLRDMERVRSAGLVTAFERELRRHPGHPLYRLLHQHMEYTLDARLIDGPALAGAVAGETAVAQGFALGLRRMFRAGWALIACYAKETLRALARPREPGDRRTALHLLLSLCTAWTAARVYRRGVRALHRGRDARSDDAWPLLAQVLGKDVRRVHPRIVAFYSNPGRFPVRAWLTLETVGSRVVSWLATRFLGQGLYETDRGPLPARFRVYRREDGSMHFVRELYCGGSLRVFDSDFVVRPDGPGGRPALHEVFPDCGIDVQMEVRVLPGGGLSIRGHAVRFHGLRLPVLPLEVEFVSEVAGGHLQIDGHLRRASGDRAELGCIHYRVGAAERAPSAPRRIRTAPATAARWSWTKGRSTPLTCGSGASRPRGARCSAPGAPA